MVEAVEIALEDFRAQLNDAVRPAGAGDRRAGVRLRRVKGRDEWVFSLPVPKSLWIGFTFSPPGCVIFGSRHICPKGRVIALSSARYGKGESQLEITVREIFEQADSETLKAARLLGEAARVLATPGDPVREVAAARAVRGVVRAVGSAPTEALASAAAESTDLGVLVRTLEQPETIEALVREDPLAPARVRGLQARERLLTEYGGTLRAPEVAGQLRLTRQAIDRSRRQGTLLALSAGRHGFLYPAWQFRREGTIEGLDRILGALSHLDPWTRQAFMLGANARLDGRRPVDLLDAGNVDRIVAAARAFGEHGAA